MFSTEFEKVDVIIKTNSLLKILQFNSLDKSVNMFEVSFSHR